MAVPAIIVHGGSFGRNADRNTYRKMTEEAASKGYAILKNGGTAVDAVEKAVRVFEEHGHFNAGRGSCLNEDGEVECDAMIMDGHNMKTGAVITARDFLHPVSIARRIMDDSNHCALSGEGALKFARSLENFDEICDPGCLKGDYPLQKIRANDGVDAHEGQEVTDMEVDSVGAVAMDKNGHLACANSTGGMPGKLKGRVSDASLVGCGGYANKFGAAVTTGRGESIMKICLAKEVVTNMETEEQNAQEAAENALRKMKDCECVKDVGGVIAIDKNGNFGKDFNTHRAVWATLKNENLEVYMKTQTSDL